MSRAWRAILCVALLAPAWGGCGGVRRERELKDSLRGFVSSVRWARWPAAAAQVVASKRGAWLDRHMRVGSTLKITDVRLEDVQSHDKEADVIVSIGWYRLPDMREERSLWRQLWRADDDAGWQLVKEERMKVEVRAPSADLGGAADWP